MKTLTKTLMKTLTGKAMNGTMNGMLPRISVSLCAVVLGIGWRLRYPARPSRFEPPGRRPFRRTRILPNSKSKRCTFRETSTCWQAPARTSRSRSARTACCLSTPVIEEMSGKVIAAIRELSTEPIRTIINTTLADDHTGANGPLVAAGSMNQAGPGLGGRPNEGDLIGHANLLRLMTEIGEDTISTDRWPPSTFNIGQKDLYSNGEAVVILHMPAATVGDTLRVVQEVRRIGCRRDHGPDQLPVH